MSSALHGPYAVTSLAFGGSGVARANGRVVFVRGAVPGDLVRVRILREKKRYVEAEAVDFERRSAQRRAPRCPAFGACGGCQWQMLPYADQLAYKEQIFADIFRRHCSIADDKLLPILEAPNEWHYRSRAQFKCHPLADGRLSIGFFRSGSHSVVDIAACPLVDPRFNDILPPFRALLDHSSFVADISQIDMESGDRPQVRLVIHYRGADRPGLEALLAQFRVRHDLALFIQSGHASTLQPLSGAPELQITVDTPPMHLMYGAGGFAQVNLEQNQRMVAEAMRMLAPDPSLRVLDLYCGMGNFSLPLARRVREVVGVEDFHGSIEQGRTNAYRNAITNARFEARPARGAYRALRPASGFDLVVLDPPRCGAREVLADLVEMPVARILYVSCDPMTLVRDLRALLNGGYRPVASRPVDMFPQTYHLESLTLLEWTRN